MSKVYFFYEDTMFVLEEKTNVAHWIQRTTALEQYELAHLNYIFCSDRYLLQVNKQYLRHHDYTDVITFDQADHPRCVEGDIFISIARVADNANTMNVPFERELHRVIIHGVLHLMGYRDKSEEDKQHMREKENFYLAHLSSQKTS